MAETSLWQNGGQSLHVGLAVKLVTNVFSKSHIAYFFHVYFYCSAKRLKFLFALVAWGTTQQICEFRD